MSNVIKSTFVAALAVVLVAGPARSATIYWGTGPDGSGNYAQPATSDWGTSANWKTGAVPGAGDIVQVGPATGTMTLDLNGGTFAVSNLTVVPRTYTFNGKTINLTATNGGLLRIGAAGLTIRNGNPVAVGFPIEVTADQMWSGGPDSPGGVASINAAISGLGQIARTNGNYASTFTFNNPSNTFSGGFVQVTQITAVGTNSTVSGGVLTQGPLGTGPLTLSGGVLTSKDTKTRTLHNTTAVVGPITLGQSATGTGALTFDTGVTEGGFSLYSTSNAVLRILTCYSTVTINHAIGESGGGTQLGIDKAGPATLVLNGANTYTGTNRISGGALRAVEGVGMGLSNNLTFNGGVFESSGTFTRTLGTDTTNVQWLSGSAGGFSANGGGLAVQLNGDPNAPLVWGNNAFMTGSTGTLLFGSTTANDVTDFQNPIDLNGAACEVDVTDNAGSTGDSARLSGVLSGSGASGLTKGGNGWLQLAGASANTYTGLTWVTYGTLELAKPDGIAAVAGDLQVGGTTNAALARLFPGTSNQIANAASVTVLTNGTFTLAGGVDMIAKLEVDANGVVNIATGRLSVGTAQEAGTGVYVNVGGTLTGDGAITGRLTANGGTVSPGAPIGSLQVSSNLVLNAGATLAIELGGTNFVFNGVENYDRVKALTNATLGGTLSVSLANGFTPAAGDLFGIVDIRGTTRTGTFTNAPNEGSVVLTAPGGRQLRITYNGAITDTTVARTGGNDVVLYATASAGSVIQVQ